MSNSDAVGIKFDLVSLSRIKARPKSFNIATAQTDDCAVLINPRALNGPFIRNDNKKSLALSRNYSRLLSFCQSMGHATPRDFIIMRIHTCGPFRPPLLGRYIIRNSDRGVAPYICTLATDKN